MSSIQFMSAHGTLTFKAEVDLTLDIIGFERGSKGNKMAIKNPSLEKAITVIKELYPEVWAIYLFGSFDTEYERPDSDMDLALLLDGPVAPLLLWELSQKIAIKINKDVQVVDLRQASTVFQNEIIRNERRVYCSKPKECDSLESVYLAMYLRLNEERKEILDDLEEG